MTAFAGLDRSIAEREEIQRIYNAALGSPPDKVRVGIHLEVLIDGKWCGNQMLKHDIEGLIRLQLPTLLEAAVEKARIRTRNAVRLAAAQMADIVGDHL